MSSVKTALTDWVAGVCSVEFAGPFSFIIGAAASLAVGDVVGPTPLPTPIPSTSLDQGDLHNALVSNYIAQGFGQMSYANVINVACQVRPDLAHRIQSISQDQFNSAVTTALNTDVSTVQAQVAFLNSVFNFAYNDLASVTNTFNSLANIASSQPSAPGFLPLPLVWEVTVDNLINQVPGFNLSLANQSGLIASLQILKSSYVLWGGSQW